jgi:hypothetical protein
LWNTKVRYRAQDSATVSYPEPTESIPHPLTNFMKQNYSKETISRSAGEEYPAFYGNPSFSTVFRTARHLLLSWARWIQSTTSPHYFSVCWMTLVLISSFKFSHKSVTWWL